MLDNRFKFNFIQLATTAAVVTAGLGSALYTGSVAADNQSPSIVNGLSISTPSNTEIAVRWNRPWDDTGIDGYNIYRDGIYYSTVRTTQFTDSNLAPGSSHFYQITAFDAAENYSTLSEQIQATTGQNQDTSATTVSAPAAVQQTSSGSSGNNRPPGNLQATEIAAGTVEWEWEWLPQAAQYEVTVDGLWAGLTDSTTFISNNLWVGDHSLSVKSVAADGRYSVSSETLKFFVSGQASASAGVQPPPPAPEIQQRAQPSAEPDTGLIDPSSWQMPGINRDGYDLVFSDEFDGNEISSARWDTNFRWDGEFNGERYEYRVINQEDQFYISPNSVDQEHRDVAVPNHNPFEFNGNRMAIRAIRNPAKTNTNRADHGSLREILSQQTFLSGALSTHDKFSQKYGYFEARIKIPSHVGTFPAFWLFHKNRAYEGTRRTEIDIMENLGHAPWYIYNSMHYFDNVSATYGGDPNFLRPEPGGQVYTGTDYSLDYHVYAVEWEPGHVTWLIDGVKTSELWHPAGDYEELYIMLNLAVGGAWTNFPTNAGGLGRADHERFPNQNDLNNFFNPALEIDYVRAYRRR